MVVWARARVQAQEFWCQDLVNLKHGLLETLRADPEQLNPDRERTYFTLSAVLMHLFDVWKNLLSDGDLGDPNPSPTAIIQADAEVGGSRACVCACSRTRLFMHACAHVCVCVCTRLYGHEHAFSRGLEA